MSLKRNIFRFIGRNLIGTAIGIPLLYASCAYIRYFGKKSIDVGLGPLPMINNIYHKKALELYGYSVETFVSKVYYITDEFDYREDKAPKIKIGIIGRYLRTHLFFLRAVSKYKCLYIYFNGGPLSLDKHYAKHEPYLLKLSGTKVVVMPYGGDVNVMNYCPNLAFKHALCRDYPIFHRSISRTEKQIRRWTEHSDHVISGCDWVDYTYHWDTLMLAHFSIDLDKISKYCINPQAEIREYTADQPLRIFHAPNHKTIKGTPHFIKAIDELKNEGHAIELVMVQGKPNSEILQEIGKADVIADQLVIGWYAMFALEAMCMQKPVICYLRQDLIDLYISSGNLESESEIPIINSNIREIKATLQGILSHEIDINAAARKGSAFVEKYHSLNTIGQCFHDINQQIGV
tara:strand:+ start:2509 stop:3720 length:1212 start_codon:yes stop_codon:yes gene_type:complete